MAATSNTKDAYLLEMGQTPGQGVPQSHTGHTVTPRKFWTIPVIIWSVLMTIFGFTGFVMAAWSTSELRRLDVLTSAVLVNSPDQIYSGYELLVNLFRGTGYWSEQPHALLYYRADHGVVSVDGTVYVFGGLSNNESGDDIVLNTLVKYDVVYNITTQLADMPQARTRFGWALLSNKIYIFGGHDAPNSFQAVPSTLIYDIATNTWTEGPTMKTGRTDMGGGAVNGKIYAIGGYTDDGSPSDVIEELDPSTQTWNVLSSRMKTARGDVGTAVVGPNIYILGGTVAIRPEGVVCEGDNAQWWLCYGFSNLVEVFNPAASTVRSAAPMLSRRGDFGTAVTSDGHILVAGGELSDTVTGVSRLLAQSSVEQYDPLDNFWTPKAPLPEPRFRFSMVSINNGRIFAYGGHPSCPTMDQQTETRCRANGLQSVVAFDDITYPGVYLQVKKD